MPVLRWALFGKRDGDFRLAHTKRLGLSANLKKACDRGNIGHLRKIFVPSCNFTTEVVSANDCEQIGDRVYKNNVCADGMVVWNPLEAVALCNGDCPVVAIYEPRWGRLAVLHAGFRCVVRESPEQGIIRVAFDRYRFDPKCVQVFVGFGIGSCCYGTPPMPANPSELLLPSEGVVRKGPYVGQPSTDIQRYIAVQLASLGVPDDAVYWDKECTACAGRDGTSATSFYHSNVYDGKDAGRNAALVWYEE